MATISRNLRADSDCLKLRLTCQGPPGRPGWSTSATGHPTRQEALAHEHGRRRDAAEPETYNPWTVVNLVFTHLAEQGLHPVLGESGDPGPPATALLEALGIEPAAEGNREVMRDVHEHLAEIRAVMLGER